MYQPTYAPATLEGWNWTLQWEKRSHRNL